MAATYSVQWFDFCQHYLTFGTLFKMCDTSQGLLFQSDDPLKIALQDLWSGNCVMRSNRAKLLLQHHEYQDWKNVLVWPSLQHVGNTSWTCSFRVTDVSGSIVLALVETTMVATDDTFTKSQPISSESKSLMMSLMQEKQQPSNHLHPVRLGRVSFSSWNNEESDVNDFVPYRYQRSVRVTDCDKLNHVNNAIYGVLAEETRLYAGSLSKYGSDDSKRASLQAFECQISYIGQAHPFEMMDIETWSCPRSRSRKRNGDGDGDGGGGGGGDDDDGESTDYRTDFFVNGEIVTRTTLTVGSFKGGTVLNDQSDREISKRQKL